MNADEHPGPSGAARPSVAMIHWVNGRAYPGPPPPPSPSAEAPPAPAGSPSPAPPPEPPP